MKGSFIVVQRVSGFARVTLIGNIVFLGAPGRILQASKCAPYGYIQTWELVHLAAEIPRKPTDRDSIQIRSTVSLEGNIERRAAIKKVCNKRKHTNDTLLPSSFKTL